MLRSAHSIQHKLQLVCVHMNGAEHAQQSERSREHRVYYSAIKQLIRSDMALFIQFFTLPLMLGGSHRFNESNSLIVADLADFTADRH